MLVKKSYRTESHNGNMTATAYHTAEHDEGIVLKSHDSDTSPFGKFHFAIKEFRSERTGKQVYIVLNLLNNEHSVHNNYNEVLKNISMKTVLYYSEYQIMSIISSAKCDLENHFHKNGLIKMWESRPINIKKIRLDL